MAKLKTDFLISDSTGYWLRKTYDAMSEHLQAQLDQHDVTVAQWPILYSIETDACDTPAKLADKLSLNRSVITRLIDRLEVKGLVKRQKSSLDKRSVELSLTLKGKRILPRLATLSLETNNLFLTGLSLEEIDLFDQTLKKIHSNSQ